MNQRGFTLIEVIIAITLLGLMMLGVYKVVDDSIITKESTLAEDAELLQIETAMMRFERDFECIYTPLFYANLKKVDPNQEQEDQQFIATEKYPLDTEKRIPVPFIENPDKKTLIFVTNTNRRKTKNSNQSHYAWVKYTLLDDGEQQNFVRYFVASDPYSPEHLWDDHKPHLLIPNVKELTFEFWDAKRERYVDSIELTEDKNIIRTVKIKMVWIDSYKTERHIERVFRSIWPFFDPKKDLEEDKDNKTGGGDEQ